MTLKTNSKKNPQKNPQNVEKEQVILKQPVAQRNHKRNF